MKRVKEDQNERSLLQVLSKTISFPRGDQQGYDFTLKYHFVQLEYFTRSPVNMLL